MKAEKFVEKLEQRKKQLADIIQNPPKFTGYDSTFFEYCRRVLNAKAYFKEINTLPLNAFSEYEVFIVSYKRFEKIFNSVDTIDGEIKMEAKGKFFKWAHVYDYPKSYNIICFKPLGKL